MIKDGAPLISVIVPVYNGERFLLAALDSVVQQNYRRLELIIVDDGSTDSTAHLVADYASQCAAPVHCISQENQGPAAARNRGLAVARGALIAFQDADDVWATGRLALQLAILNRVPCALAVLGRTRILYANPSPVAAVVAEDLAPSAPCWFLGIHSGLYRRAAFDVVGPFDATLRYHEDIDWFRRARSAGITIYPHDDVVLWHRRHATNMTHDRPALRSDLLRMLARSPRAAPMSDQSLLDWVTTKPAQYERDEMGTNCGRTR